MCFAKGIPALNEFEQPTSPTAQVADLSLAKQGRPFSVHEREGNFLLFPLAVSFNSCTASCLGCVCIYIYILMNYIYIHRGFRPESPFSTRCQVEDGHCRSLGCG